LIRNQEENGTKIYSNKREGEKFYNDLGVARRNFLIFFKQALLIAFHMLPFAAVYLFGLHRKAIST